MYELNLKEMTTDCLTSTIANLTLSGKTADEIATQLGVSTKTVQRNRKKANIPVPRGRPLEIDLTKVTELTKSGETADEIAAQLGASTKTIQRNRKKANLSVPQGRPLEIDPNKVTELTSDGLSAAQIGAQLGVSERTINGHQRKNGDVAPEKLSNRIKERPLSGYITPARNPRDRRTEQAILQEILEKDMGLVRMFYDIHTTGALWEDRANALASFSNGTFQKTLMSQNGQTLKMLGKRDLTVKVFAEERVELNSVFAANGITPVRTSIEGDAEYIVTQTELHRLRATKISNSDQTP